MKTALILRFIEAIPLSIFLVYAASIDQSLSQNWQGPYVVSSVAALFITLFFLFNKILLNRLFIGIHIYLITGSLGFLTNQVWLNQLYEKMEASAMLAWIIIAGTGSLLLSSAGFIGVVSQDRKKVVLFSLYLLLVAQIAFFLSFYLQGQKLYSEYIPFLTLFAAQSLLKSQMTKTTQF